LNEANPLHCSERRNKDNFIFQVTKINFSEKMPLSILLHAADNTDNQSWPC